MFDRLIFMTGALEREILQYRVEVDQLPRTVTQMNVRKEKEMRTTMKTTTWTWCTTSEGWGG